MKKQFAVGIPQEYVRDVQIHIIPSNEEGWCDWKRVSVFFGIVESDSEKMAKKEVSLKHSIPIEILFAQEIYNENDEYFSVIRWHKEDVLSTFDNHGIPKTENNLEIFLNGRSLKTLEERCVEEGNQVLGILVDDLKDQFIMNMTDEEITKAMIDIFWHEGTLEDEILEEWHELLQEHNSSLFSPVLQLLDIYFNDGAIINNLFDGSGSIVDGIVSQLQCFNLDYYNEMKEIYNKVLSVI